MRNDPGGPWHRLLVLFVILAALVAYAGNLDTYFIKDDLSLGILTGGGHDLDLESTWEQLLWPTERERDDIFRPLTVLTWISDYLLFGPDPAGFHLGNLLLHALNGVLLYLLVNRLTGFRNPLAGFFAGLLFVVYPLHAEAVVWMTQRFVLMGLALSLLALIAYHVHLHRRKLWHLVAAWVCVLGAALSKEVGITTPAGMAVLALMAGPAEPARRRRDLLLLVAWGAALVGTYFGLRYAVFGRFLGEGYAGWPSMQAYAEDQRIFARYPESLLACAVPASRALVPGTGWAALAGAQALALLVAMGSLIHGLRRDGRARLVATLTLVVTACAFLPTLYVFQVRPDLMNGRFGYHIMALPVALLGCALSAPWKRGPDRRGLVLRVILPGLLAVAYGAVLQVNLRAYDRGGAQVRRIQEELAGIAERSPEGAVMAVFDVPAEYAGCPTIDTYLPQLMAPPFTTAPVPAFPFVAGRTGNWLEQAAGLEGRPPRRGARGAPPPGGGRGGGGAPPPQPGTAGRHPPGGLPHGQALPSGSGPALRRGREPPGLPPPRAARACGRHPGGGSRPGAGLHLRRPRRPRRLAPACLLRGCPCPRPARRPPPPAEAPGPRHQCGASAGCGELPPLPG